MRHIVRQHLAGEAEDVAKEARASDTPSIDGDLRAVAARRGPTPQLGSTAPDRRP